MQGCLKSWCHESHITMEAFGDDVDSNVDIKTITDLLKQYHCYAAYLIIITREKTESFSIYLLHCECTEQIESTRKRTYVNNNWRKKIQWLKIYIRWTPFFLRSNEKGKRRSEGKTFSSMFFRDLYFSTQEPYYISFSRRLQHSAFASLYDNVSVRCV